MPRPKGCEATHNSQKTNTKILPQGPRRDAELLNSYYSVDAAPFSAPPQSIDWLARLTWTQCLEKVTNQRRGKVRGHSPVVAMRRLITAMNHQVHFRSLQSEVFVVNVRNKPFRHAEFSRKKECRKPSGA